LLVATRAGRGRRAGVVRAREIEALQGLAHHAALAIANARLHEHVTAMARTDPLTKLANHGEFQRLFADELGRLDRFSSLRGPEHHVSLLLLDIDHFKAFNDTFGHQAGDEVLRGVADAVRDAVRSFDQPARYGGEELAVILPETDLTGAVAVAERVREAVAGWAGGPRQVTVSVGVATAPSNGRTSAEMVAAADVALYASKEKGRNRVSVAPPGKVAAPPAVVAIETAKSRRSPQAVRRADGESQPARERSSRPTRRIPRA
jgi:diguanylate cyclase (GGDEF)-like protein